MWFLFHNYTKNNIKYYSPLFEGYIIKMQIQTGRILHLDGDRRYSEKTARHYKKMGLNAIVKKTASNNNSYASKIPTRHIGNNRA